MQELALIIEWIGKCTLNMLSGFLIIITAPTYSKVESLALKKKKRFQGKVTDYKRLSYSHCEKILVQKWH